MQENACPAGCEVLGEVLSSPRTYDEAKYGEDCNCTPISVAWKLQAKRHGNPHVYRRWQARFCCGSFRNCSLAWSMTQAGMFTGRALRWKANIL